MSEIVHTGGPVAAGVLRPQTLRAPVAARVPEAAGAPAGPFYRAAVVTLLLSVQLPWLAGLAYLVFRISG
jgi:hypothetical protein